MLTFEAHYLFFENHSHLLHPFRKRVCGRLSSNKLKKTNTDILKPILNNHDRRNHHNNIRNTHHDSATQLSIRIEAGQGKEAESAYLQGDRLAADIPRRV